MGTHLVFRVASVHVLRANQYFYLRQIHLNGKSGLSPTPTSPSNRRSTHERPDALKPWPADSPTPRYHHRYLAIDGWDYWIMDGTIEDTEVINRALLDDAWQ
jgi:hypothetical protein